MPEENLNQPINQAPEQANPSYKETLLLYNEQNGAVEAVSELKQEGRQYKAITTSPLTANKPAFFDLRNSSAVGASARPWALSSRGSSRRRMPGRSIS